MIEATLISFLETKLTVPVYAMRPEKDPGDYVIVEKTGSSVTNQIYDVTDQKVLRRYPDGTEVDSRVVTEEDEWKWKFTDLPKYDQGDEILYTVSRQESSSQIFILNSNRILYSPVHAVESRTYIRQRTLELSCFSLFHRELSGFCDVDENFLNSFTEL